MSETLRQKQSRFVRLVTRLIDFATAEGFELTFGETWRTPEQAELNAMSGALRQAVIKTLRPVLPALADILEKDPRKGIRNSLHCDRLAVDFNLFRDGRPVADHRALGEYWESLAPDCRWGGRFGDGNHYSIEHGGRK